MTHLTVSLEPGTIPKQTGRKKEKKRTTLENINIKLKINAKLTFLKDKKALDQKFEKQINQKNMLLKSKISFAVENCICKPFLDINTILISLHLKVLKSSFYKLEGLEFNVV